MEKSKKKKKRLIIILSITGVVIVSILGWKLYDDYIVTHPLGDRLEYIGNYNYGCWICDSNPTTIYFYTTDMQPREVSEYFKRAKIEDPEALSDNRLDYQTFSLIAPDEKRLFIEYHADGSHYARNFFGLRQSDKKHLIIIQDENYQIAKESL